MQADDVLQAYARDANLLVIEYLGQIERITGSLTAGMIADRFLNFNLLMQGLEHALSDKAQAALNGCDLQDDEKKALQPQMNKIFRAACQRFNQAGKPGSG